MSAMETESRGKAKRQLEAIARLLAAESRWLEAIEINQQLIERSPKDADAYNRLGKAYFELHRYRSAYEAYETAASLDPANVITQRNLSRIEPLKDTEKEDYEPEQVVLKPGTFIEEVGKTYVDDLVRVAEANVLTEISAGNRLTVRSDGEVVAAYDAQGRYIGEFEPRIAKRLNELLAMGNTYDVYVVSNSGTGVRVIIREATKVPEMGNRLSFPDQGKVAIPRAHLRDRAIFRDEPDLLLGDEDEDDEDADEEDEEAGEQDDEAAEAGYDDETPVEHDTTVEDEEED